MRRSIILILPLVLFAVSCGTTSEFSEQRFQDGIYYHQAPQREVVSQDVQLYSKEDFAYLAQQKSVWQEGDTLKINLDNGKVVVNNYWWDNPFYWGIGSYWAFSGPFFHHWAVSPFWGRWSWSSWYWNGWYDPWFGPYYPYGPYGPGGFYHPVHTRPSGYGNHGAANLPAGRISRGGSTSSRPSASGSRSNYSTRYYTPRSGSTSSSSNSRSTYSGSTSRPSTTFSRPNSRSYDNNTSNRSTINQSRPQSSPSQRSSSSSSATSGANSRSYGGGTVGGGASRGGFSGGGASSGGGSRGGGGGTSGGGRR